MTKDELEAKLKRLIKDVPSLIDYKIDSLVALKQVNITWENSGLTRGELIDVRNKVMSDYHNLVRTKFNFDPNTWDTLTQLARDKGVSEGEIIARALGLYASLVNELKQVDSVIVNRDHVL